MKKLIPLLASLMLICGCSASPPSLPAAQTSSVNQTDSSSQTSSQSQPDQTSGESPAQGFYGWNDFRDLSGELIDFSNKDVKGIDVNYSVGWNQDSSGYKKIRRGDKVGGYDVVEVAANYYIEYRKEGPPAVICNRNDYTVECGNVLPGVLVINQDGINFYAYYNKQKENFFFICERNADSEREFADQSTFSVSGGKTIHVQPIHIACQAFTDTQFIKEITKMAIGKTSDNPEFYSTLTESVYLDAEITFESINFYPFSDGEGAGIFGTRAVGFVNSIDKIKVKSKL